MNNTLVSDRTHNLVTKGNRGFVAANTPLYKRIEKGIKTTKQYNVAPGQPVMWRDDNVACGAVPVTITPATLTLADFSTLRIAVGVSTKKDGITDALRSLTPTELEGCNIDKLDAVAPQCSVPSIKAAYPYCIDCDPITMRVRVTDNRTLTYAQEALKGYEEFVFTYTPDCFKGCTDCPSQPTCDEVVCGLIDAVRQEGHYKVGDEIYPHTWGETHKTELPFEVFKIYPTWLSYCISPGSTAPCTECNSIAALTTYTVNGVTYNFDLTDPADNTRTLIKQLEYAVDQINSKLTEVFGRHAGRVFLSKGSGTCCPVQIFATTCDTTFAITGLTPCTDVIDQFPDFITMPTCAACGTTGTTTTPNCGIGVFVKQEPQECGECWDVTQEPSFKTRIVDIDFISPSGNDGVTRHSKIATLLNSRVASGFGAEVRWLEYTQQDPVGLEGFQYEYGNTTGGFLGIPQPDSRVRQAVTASCDTSYCSYYFRTRGKLEQSALKTPLSMVIDGYIWVPQGDTVTKTAIEDLEQKIVDLLPGTCQVVTGLKCDGTTIV